MPEKIKFKKQYKPIGFGDRPSKDTVEGHRGTLWTMQQRNRLVNELAAKQEAR